ncbi:MAG: FecR family protein [Longimicrobiales bacterium]
MDELIIKVLGGDATAEEVERLDRWRREAPEHQARYDAVRRVWTATPPSPLKEAMDLSVVPRIVQAAEAREEGARAPEGVGGRDPGSPPPVSRRMRAGPFPRWALPLAAALGAIGLGVYQWSLGPDSSTVFEASGDGSETFVLDDGSFVRLARGSRLTQVDGEEERRFQLEGRALFAVTHDETRPFVVTADGVETRVLGTRFEVRAMDEGAHRVLVLEGRVEVSNPLGREELSAGELSVASPNQPPSRTRPDDLLALLDWAEGALLFQSTPLAQVAREVGRRYGTRVVVEGEALQGTRISAWYGTEPFQDVVESLCAATRASCTVTDTLAVLR